MKNNFKKLIASTMILSSLVTNAVMAIPLNHNEPLQDYYDIHTKSLTPNVRYPLTSTEGDELNAILQDSINNRKDISYIYINNQENIFDSNVRNKMTYTSNPILDETLPILLDFTNDPYLTDDLESMENSEFIDLLMKVNSNNINNISKVIEDSLGSHNLHNYFDQELLNDLYETVVLVLDLTAWEIEYLQPFNVSYSYNEPYKNIHIYEVGAKGIEFMETLQVDHNERIEKITFQLNDYGVDALENILYNFNYNEFIENNHITKFNNDLVIQTLNEDNIHTLENYSTDEFSIWNDYRMIATGGDTYLNYDMSGYVINNESGDILYVNLDKISKNFNYDRIGTYQPNHSYMVFLVNEDADYPFSLLEYNSGSKTKSEILDFAKDFFQQNTIEKNVESVSETVDEIMEEDINEDIIQSNSSNNIIYIVNIVILVIIVFVLFNKKSDK